ncbi:MAG: dolichyl-phosphate mannose synthase [Gemmatimonadetes bacterium]|nr:MAG: dolichyl-phosphate mannose synthase [Gemmatimonadota bacterium]
MSATELALVMPMAGRGSRFASGGHRQPKPLIDVAGRPAFWWATESVRRSGVVGEMVYVVLAEHVASFGIDEIISSHYSDARVVTISEVTAGAAESAAIGVAALESSGPVAVNDCDHAFRVDGLRELVASLTDSAEGALLGFRSASPAYSYVALDVDGRVRGTVEKDPVSPFAIAGCYLFASPVTFLEGVARYRAECEYPELYVSGVYNTLLRGGAHILFHELDGHAAFGTPEELTRVDAKQLEQLLTASS